MNKLIFTLNVFILLGILPTQSMEKENKSTLQTNVQNSDCPLPNFKLEDELIFVCCVIQEVDPRKALTESQKALNDSIKNFMTMRSTCKHYYKSLTCEKIGDSCKNHHCFTKKLALRNFSNTLTDFCIKHITRRTDYYDIKYTARTPIIKCVTKTEEYDSSKSIFRPPLPSRLDFRCRMRMLILLHTLINENNNSSLLTNLHLWLEKTLEENDTSMLEALLKAQIIHPNTKTTISKLTPDKPPYPLFFYAKTIEMAQLCIKYGADLNATINNPTYNVLAHVNNNNYTWQLEDFYLDHGVKELKLQ